MAITPYKCYHLREATANLLPYLILEPCIRTLVLILRNRLALHTERGRCSRILFKVFFFFSSRFAVADLKVLNVNVPLCG